MSNHTPLSYVHVITYPRLKLDHLIWNKKLSMCELFAAQQDVDMTTCDAASVVIMKTHWFSVKLHYGSLESTHRISFLGYLTKATPEAYSPGGTFRTQPTLKYSAWPILWQAWSAFPLKRSETRPGLFGMTHKASLIFSSLTHWGQVTHICVRNIIHHWFR